MLRVVDFETRRVPIMASKSAIELFELDKLGTLRYLQYTAIGELLLQLNDGRRVRLVPPRGWL